MHSKLSQVFSPQLGLPEIHLFPSGTVVALLAILARIAITAHKNPAPLPTHSSLILGILATSTVSVVINYFRYIDSLDAEEGDKDSSDNDNSTQKTLGKKQFRLIQVFQPVSSISGEFFRFSNTKDERRRARESIERHLIKQKDVGSDDSMQSENTLVDSGSEIEEGEDDSSDDGEGDYNNKDNNTQLHSLFMENYPKSVPSTPVNSVPSSPQSDNTSPFNTPELASSWKFTNLLSRLMASEEEAEPGFQGLRPLKLVHGEHNLE
ncbi:DEKNAAC104047 [Brettanomyces naardenensis]|uniref:DEKNAAC104047 n=1 Tax=Brettanomyces naardenensis TaxID=13370 RepID=A0A448YQH6_BRENA|nr:DEKNAAC104047 [Brettanomyces naardenensis]